MVLSMTTAELQTKRDALVSAVATGVTEITIEGRTIRYQSTSQMVEAIALLDREIATSAGTSSARSILVQHSRG
jgi:hypothetical protein